MATGGQRDADSRTGTATGQDQGMAKAKAAIRPTAQAQIWPTARLSYGHSRTGVWSRPQTGVRPPPGPV
jgi:hypothetical protein